MTEPTAPSPKPPKMTDHFPVAMKRTIRYTIKKIRALPRSVDRTRIPTWMSDRIVASTAFSFVTSPLNIPASINMNRILTNSEGWKVKPRIVDVIWAPFVSLLKRSTAARGAIPSTANTIHICRNESKNLRKKGITSMIRRPAEAMTNCLIGSPDPYSMSSIFP